MGAGERQEEPARHLGAEKRLEPGLRRRTPGIRLDGIPVEREAVLEEEIRGTGVPVADGGGVHHDTYRRAGVGRKIPGAREQV